MSFFTLIQITVSTTNIMAQQYSRVTLDVLQQKLWFDISGGGSVTMMMMMIVAHRL